MCIFLLAAGLSLIGNTGEEIPSGERGAKIGPVVL